MIDNQFSQQQNDMTRNEEVQTTNILKTYGTKTTHSMLIVKDSQGPGMISLQEIGALNAEQSRKAKEDAVEQFLEAVRLTERQQRDYMKKTKYYKCCYCTSPERFTKCHNEFPFISWCGAIVCLPASCTFGLCAFGFVAGFHCVTMPFIYPNAPVKHVCRRFCPCIPIDCIFRACCVDEGCCYRTEEGILWEY
jgi:hypothetical protein